MSSPKYAKSDDAGRRWYTLPGGEKFLSVTTIISSADSKPGLLTWSANLATDRAIEYRDVIAATPDLTTKQRGDVRKWCARASEDYREWTSGLGTRVHTYAEHDILGTAPPLEQVPADVLPFAVQWQRFRTDHRPVFHAAEMTVINRTVGYAGTLDQLMSLNGDTIPKVADIKSGATGPYLSWGLQLAALANAETVLLADGSEHPMPEVDLQRGYSLRILPGSYHAIPVEFGNLYQQFRAMVFLARNAYVDKVWPFGPDLSPQPAKAVS